MTGSEKKPVRGFVLVTVAVAVVAICGALGLTVDLGRMFIAKNETQAYSDAAALAATLKLNGTSLGVTRAQAAVANSTNAWNLDSARISDYQVDFATGPSGPWVSNPIPATGYIYSRVRATVPVQLYFMPMVAARYSQDVISKATAAQVAQTSFSRGLNPFTVVSTDPTSPTFGLVVGNQYDIQWPQYNGSRAGCTPATPDRCFVSPPCSGDPLASRAAVSQYWGASINGYWGGNAASTIYKEVLDLIQLQAIAVGQQITLTSGDMNSESKALDQRVNEDGDTLNNSVTSYEANAYHNGRRLVALPVVRPTASGTFVLGYGAFLLMTNGTPSNFYRSGTGNEPFCAVYAGPYVAGSTDPGGSGTAGAYRVALVQ